MNPKILDNFSKNEILSILENECKFFESVLNEVKPNYAIMHEPYQHHDELFFEICKFNDLVQNAPSYLRLEKIKK